MAASWLDLGVKPYIYISESGDFVKLGTTTEYPFVAGGAGVPSGWTQYVGNGGVVGDVSWNTAYGRFSVGNLTTDVHHGKRYGIYRDFTIKANKRYLINVEARTTQGRSYCIRYFQYIAPADSTYRNTSQIWTYPDWEKAAWYYVSNEGHTTLRVWLFAAPYTMDPRGKTVDSNWGIQFTNFTITEMEMSYPDPTWHEVTCDVRGITTHYGRDKFTGRYDVATATLTIKNDDGEFRYREDHPWGLRPGRFIYIRLGLPLPMGGNYDMFYGIIDSLNDGYSLDGHVVTNVQCVDVSSLLSNTNVPTYGSEQSTYWSGARFQAMYRAAGWLPQMAYTDGGTFIQQAMLASGRSIRDELGLIADSEGCLFYTDRRGNLNFRDRTSVGSWTTWNNVGAELCAQCPDYLDEVKFEFPGVTGNGMTSEPSPGLTDIDFYARVKFNDISSAAQQRIGGQNTLWYVSKRGGNKQLQFTGFSTVSSNVDLPYNSGDIFWIRVTYTNSDRIAQFWHCADRGTDSVPPTGSFIRLGSNATNTGAIPTGTQPYTVGSGSSSHTSPLNGRLYRIFIRNFPTTGSMTFDIYPQLVPGTTGASLVRLPNGKLITVSQTGSNMIIQVDPTIKPYRLVPVDSVPTSSWSKVVLLRDLTVDWSRDRVINDLSLANQGGTTVRYQNFDSQSKYGPRSYSRLDFVNDDSHPEYLDTRANDLMEGWTEARLRVNQVIFKPVLDDYEFAVSVFLHDLVRIRYQHETQGWGYAIVSHVQGITHELTLHGWTVALNVDQPISYVSWDTPPGSLTGWDQDKWDEGLWDGTTLTETYWGSGQVWGSSDSIWGP